MTQKSHCSDTVERVVSIGTEKSETPTPGLGVVGSLSRQDGKWASFHADKGVGRCSFCTGSTEAFPSTRHQQGPWCHLWCKEGFPWPASARERSPSVACSPSVPSENAPPCGPLVSNPDCPCWQQGARRVRPGSQAPNTASSIRLAWLCLLGCRPMAEGSQQADWW